jgi:hypothetical protein
MFLASRNAGPSGPTAYVVLSTRVFESGHFRAGAGIEPVAPGIAE